MRWTLSPALFVWTMTTRLPAALSDQVHSPTAVTTARHRERDRIITSTPSFHEGTKKLLVSS
jgi:hypothetical protein